MPTSLIEVHEDRIQRLEEGVSDCRVDIAGLTSKVDDVKCDVRDGFAMVSQKLDGFTKLDERVTEIETLIRVRKEVKKHNRDRLKQAMKVSSVVGAVLVGLGGLVAKILFGN